jgi:hypothetical protein
MDMLLAGDTSPYFCVINHVSINCHHANVYSDHHTVCEVRVMRKIPSDLM